MKQYTVEFYSRRPSLWRRRQYHWRIRHANGNIIARSSEGYSNRLDRDMVFRQLRAGIRDESFEVTDLDKRNKKG